MQYVDYGVYRVLHICMNFAYNLCDKIKAGDLCNTNIVMRPEARSIKFDCNGPRPCFKWFNTVTVGYQGDIDGHRPKFSS